MKASVVTPEMKEAGAKAIYEGQYPGGSFDAVCPGYVLDRTLGQAEASYLVMRPLDPEWKAMQAVVEAAVKTTALDRTMGQPGPSIYKTELSQAVQAYQALMKKPDNA